MRTSKLTIKKIVQIALLAALTAVSSSLRIPVPAGIAGMSYFHLGNILCALSGILLGPIWGGLASGLGSALYDLSNPAFAADCWITFITKGIYGLVAGLIIYSGKKDWGYGKAVLAAAAAAITYALIYLAKGCFYDSMLLSGLSFQVAFPAVTLKLPATIFNATVAIIGAPPLAVAIRASLKKSHLSID